MPRYSQWSKDQLASCHTDLQVLFNEVIKHYDCRVLEGARDRVTQEKAFREGNTTLHFPHSKHNSLPSRAVDVAPYPVRWPGPGLSQKENEERVKRFMHFAGFVQGLAAHMGIPIRWGGDWNENLDFTDSNFVDLPHFELKV